jgi:hypothetical protein
MSEKDFEVTELDDSELDGVAGGADPNNCNCPIQNGTCPSPGSGSGSAS